MLYKFFKVAVCKAFEINEVQLEGHKRIANLVDARHCYSFLCKKYTNMSLVGIGATLGNRDHSTIISSIRKHEIYFGSDHGYTQKFNDALAEVRKLVPSRLLESKDTPMITLDMVNNDIEVIKRIIFTFEGVEDENFSYYKRKLNKLLDLQESLKEKQIK